MTMHAETEFRWTPPKPMEIFERNGLHYAPIFCVWCDEPLIHIRTDWETMPPGDSDDTMTIVSQTVTLKDGFMIECGGCGFDVKLPNEESMRMAAKGMKVYV